MTFSLKLNNAKILKGIVETLTGIIDETEFRVTPEEFIISAMDPSRICLLKLLLKKENFDEYQCDKDSKVGLNLNDLNKILKRSGQKDSLLITFDENEQKIKIKMQREGNSRSRTFSLMLLDIETENVPIDNLFKIEYLSSWMMEPNLLIEALKDAEIYSEILQIESIKDEGLNFSSYGQIGEMEYRLGEKELVDFDSSDRDISSYSISFLSKILKLTPIIEKLEISLKTDHPLKMIFNLLEGGELSYFLAPRVEESEDVEDEEF